MRFSDDIDALVELTSDNAAQQESLQQVRKLSDAKLAELRETIELRRKSGLEAALAVIRADQGKKIMDELRGVVAEMESREQQLLKERNEAANDQRRPHHLDDCRVDAHRIAGVGRCRRGADAHRAIRRPRRAAQHSREKVGRHRHSLRFRGDHRRRSRGAADAVGGLLRPAAPLRHALSGSPLGGEHRRRRAGDPGHRALGAGGRLLVLSTVWAVQHRGSE